jgi:FKBP-type peptidyl-prolyl cis-trans isomerase (trigger factor)
MAKKSTKSSTSSIKGTYVVAKSEDGTLQITYTIPYDEVTTSENLVLAELAKDTTVPGFRKGKAPISKVKERISHETLLEKSLGRILPKYLAETLTKEKFRIAIYPKFELISAKEGEPWQIRATTCEVPKLELGDYKKEVAGKARASAIVTSPNAKASEVKELTHEEKEQLAISALISTSKVAIPKILLEEEVNARLAKLLERLERLGLSLDQYLGSISKTAENLRTEYEDQSRQALLLDLALLTLADKEGIKVEDAEINDTIKASAGDPDLAKRLETPEEKSLIRTVLLKKKALEKIVSYL